MASNYSPTRMSYGRWAKETTDIRPYERIQGTKWYVYYDSRPDKEGYKVNKGAFLNGHSKWAIYIAGPVANDIAANKMRDALEAKFGTERKKQLECIAYLNTIFRYKLGLIYTDAEWHTDFVNRNKIRFVNKEWSEINQIVVEGTGLPLTEDEYNMLVEYIARKKEEGNKKTMDPRKLRAVKKERKSLEAKEGKSDKVRELKRIENKMTHRNDKTKFR